jgi:hypothetical protein
MKIAFYKGIKGNLFDMLIGLWTRSAYSHVELVFEPNPVAFSSSNRDGGTRFKPIEFDAAHWDFLECPSSVWTPQRDDAAYGLCQELQGKKYDWAGVFGFATPLAISNQDTRKWFCSEVVTYVLKTVGLASMNWPRSANVDPGELYKLARAAGWQKAGLPR